MIRSFNKRLLPLLLIVLAIGVWSCTKDDDETSGQVELLSFGPTGAMHGDTLHFIGNNLEKVTAIQFTGDTVEQKNFIQQTPEQIMVIVPEGVEQGYVTLKTPDGDIVSKTRLNLEVVTTVTAITPEVRPGENVTITGNFLNWVSSVTFANDKVVDSFVSKSLTQLVVTVPEDAQTGPLVLSFGGTEPTSMQTADTLKVTLPVATALAPNPAKHADNLTITGTNLDLTTEVLFSGVATPVTSFVSKTATELVVKVPGGTQKGKIMLEALSGVQTTSNMELDVLMPAVTAMPTNPVNPGTDITISGTNLDLVDSITFQNAAAVKTFVSQSATQIVVKVPMGVTEGKMTLHVKNSSLIVQSPDILKIAGAVPPPTLALPIYNDAITSNWTSTGWVGNGWGRVLVIVFI